MFRNQLTTRHAKQTANNWGMGVVSSTAYCKLVCHSVVNKVPNRRIVKITQCGAYCSPYYGKENELLGTCSTAGGDEKFKISVAKFE
jgi:hypothetical protein